MNRKFTLEKYQEIIDLLANSKKTLSEIAKETNSSPSYVKKINDGKVKSVRLAFQDIVFPIREPKQERNKRIIDDLDNGMSVREVAQKYDLADSSIRMILYRTNK